MANGVIKKRSEKALSALKEGRVLSAANMRSMVEALRAMVAVMRKAGFEMERMDEKHLQGKHDQREHKPGGLLGLTSMARREKAVLRLEFARTWLSGQGHSKLADRVDAVMQRLAKPMMAVAA